jgi:hypothetical protein
MPATSCNKYDPTLAATSCKATACCMIPGFTYADSASSDLQSVFLHPVSRRRHEHINPEPWQRQFTKCENVSLPATPAAAPSRRAASNRLLQTLPGLSCTSFELRQRRTAIPNSNHAQAPARDAISPSQTPGRHVVHPHSLLRSDTRPSLFAGSRCKVHELPFAMNFSCYDDFRIDWGSAKLEIKGFLLLVVVAGCFFH